MTNKQNLIQIKKIAKNLKPRMVKFLRDIVAIPSESTQEEKVVARIKKEMESLNYDDCFVDPMGNVIGKIGSGKPVIAVDAHIDTVGIGDRSTWNVDPYKGKYENGWIYGRGSADQKSGMVSSVYGGYIAKKLGLVKDYTYLSIGSIMEEDDEGSNWLIMVKKNFIPKPSVVIITEPTNKGIYRGHRGRMLVEISVIGRSCHASAPERGLNAGYWASKIALEVEKLNNKLPKNSKLGKGSIALSQGELTSPSQNAVCDKARLLFDRRINEKESKKLVIKQLLNLDSIKKAKKVGLKIEIKVPIYEGKSFRNYKYKEETYYPAWILSKNQHEIKSAVKTFELLFEKKARIGVWTFSTNAARIVPKDMLNIPAVGYGPGNEVYAHGPDEKISGEDLVMAAAFYASYSLLYREK